MTKIKFDYVKHVMAARVLEMLDLSRPIGVDIETTALEPHRGEISLIQLSDGEQTVILDVIEMGGAKAVPKIVVDIIGDPSILKVSHNAKFEMKWLMHHLGAEPESFFDTMLASQIIAAGDATARHDLGTVADTFTQLQLDKGEQKSDWSVRPLTQSQLEYAAWDAVAVLPVREAQVRRLEADDLLRTATIEFDALRPIARTELNGLHLDKDRWTELLTEKKAALAVLHGEMMEIFQAGVDWTEPNPEKRGKRPVRPVKPVNYLRSKEGRSATLSPADREFYEGKYKDELAAYEKALVVWQKDFDAWDRLPAEIPATLNPGSVPQMKKVIFNVTGLNLESTNTEKVLVNYVDDYPAIAKLVEYREAAKSVSSYGDNFLEHAELDGRVRTNFKQIKDTGRMGSAEPNIQNIPSDEKHRRCFTAPPGRKLVIADYSQIELRVLAELSRDPNFVGDFNSGEDMHVKGARRFFRIPDSVEVTKDKRKEAKAVNFGTIFGIMGQALARRIGSTDYVAERLIDAYFVAYPGNKLWLDRANDQARHHLFARTRSGRLQRFSHDGSRGQINAIGRNGMNMPIQGCIHGDSRIFCQGYGYQKIKDMVGQSVIVWDGYDWVSAFVASSGLKKRVDLTFAGNLRITVSPDHKFWTVSQDGRWRWRTAEQLGSPNIRVAVSNSIPGDWRVEDIKFPEPVDTTAHNASKARIEDIGDDFDIGLFLGRLASDGTYSKRGVTLMVAGHESMIKPKLWSIIKKLGYVNHRDMSEYKTLGAKPLYFLSIFSKSLSSQIMQLNLKNQIPDQLWQSKEMLRGFLRGMFDGDGTVNKDGASLVFGKVHYYQKYAEDIQQALMLFGVRSRINFNADRISVRVLKRDSPVFLKEIGFMHPEKTAKLASVEPGKVDGKIYGRALTVTKVEFFEEEIPMFDVVDSESSQFMVNGLVTHNTAADMLKRALFFADVAFRGTSARIVNIVHDEIVVECDAADADWVSTRLTDCMVSAGKEYISAVDVLADALIADEWVKD